MQHTYKDQKWKEEHKQFLLDHKDLPRTEVYKLFCEKFPGFCTFAAMCDKRSRIGAVTYSAKHGTTKAKPLYSEQRKKGYIRIKVAQPNVWWQKQRWVYVETHPEEYNDIEETDCYYFLDGNNKNFDPANIVRVKRREQTIFQFLGGVVKDNPELTKQHILQARLKLAQLDVGEKLGLVADGGGGRVFIDERNAKARAYQKKRYAESEEVRKKKKVNKKKYMEKLKLDPERYEKYKEHKREWFKKHREKKKNVL